jgi:DNA-binding LacI/PurR family transcriptional regulator
LQCRVALEQHGLVTTVSHALNNKGRVDVHTRERVRRAASDLGYRASHAARGLRAGRTWTLGLMLPQGPAVAGTQDYFGIEFYLDLAVGAAQAAFAQRHGLTSLPDVASARSSACSPSTESSSTTR